MRLVLFLLVLATPVAAQELAPPLITLSDAVWGLAVFLAVILVLAYIGSRR